MRQFEIDLHGKGLESFIDFRNPHTVGVEIVAQQEQGLNIHPGLEDFLFPDPE